MKKTSEVKSQDCVVVRDQFQPCKPHGDMLMLGYKFVASHITVDALIDQDVELDTPSRVLVAVEHEGGVNFYAKGKSTEEQL